jgi:hypothetical protein
MKRFTGVTLFAVLSAASGIAQAQQATGQFQRLWVNSDVSDRGSCVSMNVPPTLLNHACVWKANPLYKEINATLVTAFAMGATCTVYWRTTELAYGGSIIHAVECAPR